MFSNKTLLEIAKSLNFQTHDEVERFDLEFGLGVASAGPYLKQKETAVAKHLIANPAALGPNGSALAIELLEHAINRHRDSVAFSERYCDLDHSLEKDGFELTDTSVRRKLPLELPVAEQENQLVSLLNKFGFSIAQGHYQQAVAAHGRGEWAAANAQLRSFVEEFFDRTQDLVCPGSHKTSHDRRTALAQSGFFIQGYNEFLFNGKGFVEGFWNRLHPEGSHPGLSEHADSTFRLHLVILVISHFISRLESHQS
ncbi:MAG: hypothetical protein BA863_16075 [Desulfovibrio sp. S3730MH75]|nr:MAG: hypothetical protein BA863_16075 [Desulfovibrio sp. S3730MH75]